MKLRSIRPFAAILLLAALVFSCGKTKVIPRGKFIDIYVDMFVADQWIRDNPDVKRKTDTLKVYEGIFNRYGYTTEDYAKTVRHYMREPDKFVKVMKKVVKRLDAREKETKALIAKLEKMDKFHIKSSPVADSLLRRFSADSFYVGRPDVVVNRYFDIILGSFDRDTVYSGGRRIPFWWIPLSWIPLPCSRPGILCRLRRTLSRSSGSRS